MIRHLLPVFFALSALSSHAGETSVSTRLLVQESPLAGFQFHEGKHLWENLRIGDRLDLIREPDNPYDARAVRVEWQGQFLGYVPRADNEAVARQLDRGAKLAARIARLKQSRNPWQRVLFEVYVDSAR
ncbi:MAG: HIRAN domain-containing protein [Sulfuricellaceae bacterium]